MSFATIAGWLMSGFAMRIYAAGFSVWLAAKVAEFIIPVMHAASTALTLPTH